MVINRVVDYLVKKEQAHVVHCDLSPSEISGPYKKRSVRWTNEEEQFLINNYKEIYVKDIMNCPEINCRHSINAIYKKAKRLGLMSSNPFNDKEHNELLGEKLRTEANDN